VYFQKLESLYSKGLYKSKNLILDAFDEWLAFVPKTYRDRLSPDMFQINQEVNIVDSLNLFDDAVKVGILKHRYMLMCSCGYVMKFYENEVEQPKGISYKKKTFPFQENGDQISVTLSSMIEKDLSKFANIVGEDKLSRVVTPQIRNSLLALKSGI